MSHPVPHSLRWRLPLIVALIAIAAALAWMPTLLPALSEGRQDTFRGMVAGAGTALAVLLLILAIPAARQTYFQLLEAREQGAQRDARVGWLMGIAVVLYVLTLILARWAVPQATASPGIVIGLGLLPLLAMILYSTATLLHLRQLDELMRKIEMESWALSALVVSQAYFAAWVLLKAGLVHIDTGNALLWLGLWLLLVRTGVYVWLMRRYL
ncbi:MAG: hypothetical protein ABWX87_04340 [Pseudoxanthomonas sp.]